MGARKIEQIRFYPNTLATTLNPKPRSEWTVQESQQAESQAARLRAALHHTVAHPALDAADPTRVAKSRWKILEKLDTSVTKEPSPINLSDFDIPVSQEAVINRLKRSTFLPGAETPEFQELVEKAMTVTDRSYFNQRDGEGHRLIQEFDRLAFKRIQEEYGLGSLKDARRFFEERVEEANHVLAGMLPPKVRKSGDDASLINEASFITSPGRAVLYALSQTHVDPRLQYETLRTLTVAEIFALSVKHADGLKSVIEEFQIALGDSIFDHGQRMGEVKHVPIYAIFDGETGEPLWNSHSDPPLSPHEYDEYSKRGMLKCINFNVRQSDDAGYVFTDPRTKGKRSILEKVIRDAQRKKDLVGDEMLEPNAVSDLGGIMQVLLDETSLDGDTIKRFIARHKTIAEETFGKDNTRFVERDETNGDNGQSEKHHFRRVDIIVTKDDEDDQKRDYKIEMLFVPLKAHLINQYQFGSVDSDTQQRNGPAHKIYEAIRWKNVARALFPKKFYGDINWNELSAIDSERAATDIKLQDTIPFEMLPAEYGGVETTLFEA